MRKNIPPQKNKFRFAAPVFARFFLLIFFPLVHTAECVAQTPVTPPAKPRTALTGTVEGRVYDLETNESLIGAAVAVQGSALGGATNAEGQFQIRSVPEGVHTLVFSYVGYQPATVPGVQVKAGTITRVNHKLVAASNALGEVVVKAEINLENSTELSLINEIKGSRNIVSGISNEQISRSLDRDAAEVVRRVTGVTLMQDRFVVIRGLDPRYTLTLLNDLPTPSSENDRKSFSYDMLNSSTIDRIVVYKTPAPELQGDFAGGVVKVYTKNSANARQFQVQLSGQYRPGSSFSDLYTYRGGKYDQLGYDDGTRALPGRVPTQAKFPEVDQSSAAEVVALNARAARTFRNNWSLLRDRSNFDRRAVLNYYDHWRLGKAGLSSLSSVTYTLTTDVNEISRQYGPMAENGSEPPYLNPIYPRVTASDTMSVRSARISGLQNFSLRLNDRHTLEFKNFFNQLSRDQVTVRDYRTSESSDYDYANNLYKTFQYYFRSRGLYTGLLSGDHAFGKTAPTKLTWRLGYSRTNEQQPDLRRFTLERTQPLPGGVLADPNRSPDAPGSFRFRPLTFFNNLNNSRFFSTLRESAYTGGADVEKTFAAGLTVKAGVFSDYRARQYDSRFFTYFIRDNARLSEALNDLATGPGRPQPQFNADALFAPTSFPNNGDGYAVADYSGLSASPGYEAANEQHAAYAALNIPLLGKRLNVYGGARLEWNQLQSETGWSIGQDRDTLVVTDQTKLYVLPSVNVSYKLHPKLSVRAAYGMSLNRPEFREVAPIRVYDLDRIAYYEGNPSLTNAEVQNVDLRWEYYPSEDEMLSLGFYYKDFKNAIEYVSFANPSFASDEIRYINTPQTTAYGLEAEVRKRLDFIPVPFFQNVSIIANATFLSTRVEIPDSLLRANVNVNRSLRPLQGASPYAFNGGIYYDNAYTGTQVTALYNVIGQRLALAGNYFTPEQFELPRQAIDLSVTQRLTPHLKVRAGVQDLLNQPYRSYRDVNSNTRFDANRSGPTVQYPDSRVSDYLEMGFRPGSYYSLGLLFSL